MSIELDAAQQRVVDQLKGGLLVLAPVGSGKTFALTERIGRALDVGKLRPERILTLTFTNRAAREVQQRLADRFPDQVERLWISTFHGLCATILRREARAAGLPADFTICDETDSLDLLREISPLDQDAARAFFRDLERAKTVLSSRELSWPLDFARLFAPLGEGRVLARLYQDELRQQGRLDFGDLVLLTNALFARRADVRQRWEERFDLVQVDEVQDTHRSEYNVIWVLAHRGRNLALFGDLDQTIYGWRGSDPDAIVQRFRHDFAPVVELSLGHNRRATRNLVQAADQFAASFEQRWGSSAAGAAGTALPGEAITVHYAPDPEAEASWIAERVGELLSGQDGPAYRRIGILTGTNQRGLVISAVLQRAGVGHVTVEQLEFFRRQEVKDALAYLRLMINPDDTGAILRTLERPDRKIGRDMLARLRRQGEPLGLHLVDFIRPATFTHGDPFGRLLEAYREGSLTVFDLETTGLDDLRAEIVEVGAIRLESGQPTRSLEALVQTSLLVGPSTDVHGLHDADLAAGRPPEQVLGDLFALADGSLLVGHNVAFDLRMLFAQAARLGLTAPEVHFADTLQLARRFIQAPDYSLAGLARHLGLEHRPDHRAMLDVEATCELLRLLLPRLAEHEAERRALLDREAEPFADLAGLLDDWRTLAESCRPAELLDQVLDESGLFAHYADDPRRSASLQELLRAFELLDQPSLPPVEALYQVVNQTALARGLEQLVEREDRVAISTIHQAKGLEFDAVFVAGLTEGELPRRRSIQEGRLGEEQRLFYVALTRARRRLFLSSHARTARGPTRPSQFLRQLDPELLRIV
jgi:DNA helicase-2/ATP-dependent DNA helicase PcrA